MSASVPAHCGDKIGEWAGGNQPLTNGHFEHLLGNSSSSANRIVCQTDRAAFSVLAYLVMGAQPKAPSVSVAYGNIPQRLGRAEEFDQIPPRVTKHNHGG
ncbi:MAG TPA: hypothetical protein VGJ26_20820 [Pirellulales bacterium]